ncbi:hypothetical protein [Calditerrivibrio nitroreducens]|uniref:GspE/PulE/PilB domain-containing protein n=1 Tax=Calditerrivibrio nitroreducens TaxID=477976 RepID=UPI003C7070B6
MKKLGEILLEKKILTKEELAQLLAKQQITRERLGDLVVKAGFLTTESLLNIVAEQYGLQYFNLKELVIPVALQKEVNFEILKKYRVVPVKLEDKKLFLGINDVSLLKDIDEIAFNLGKTIVPVLLSEISIDRILVDLEKLPYGTKDYQFKSLELIMQGGKNFDTLIITIIDYDDKIERIFIKENAPPFIKKSNMIEKIPYDSFTKSQILNIIKEVCDENERRSLVSNGFVRVKRSIMSKRFTLNFYKEKNSFFILVINNSSSFLNISNFKLGKDINKYLLEPAKGIFFLIAPFGHGKSSFITSIIDYLNSVGRYNILYIAERLNETLRNNRSNIVQIERSMIKDRAVFSEILNDFDPNILFIDNIDSSEMFSNVYKFVEAGRPAYIAFESNSIHSSVESLLYKESESSYKYHLNRLADNVKLFMNFRLVPSKNGQDKFFVYEYCVNSYKLKKIIRDNALNLIHTQVRGTGDYIPFELQLADLFLNNLITYEVAENFSLDVDLFKRHAKING